MGGIIGKYIGGLQIVQLTCNVPCVSKGLIFYTINYKFMYPVGPELRVYIYWLGAITGSFLLQY